VSAAALLPRAVARQLPGSAVRALRRRPPAVRSALRPGLEPGRNGPGVNGHAWEISLDEHLAGIMAEGSLPHLLRYEDRNSMAFSIEARVPYLDHRVVEYCFTRGSDHRIRDGWTKWALRQAVTDMLPASVVWRRDKVGFETPELKWIETIWPRVRDRVLGGRAADTYLDRAFILDAERTPATTAEEARRRWRWINLAVWMEAW
jgi:asparagine synthase (glutamine-hydrolysing)